VVVDVLGMVVHHQLFRHHMVLEMVEVMDPQVVVEVHTVQVVAVAVLVMVMVVLAQVLNHYLVGLVLAVVVQVVIHLVLMEVMEFSYQPHIMTHLSWLLVVQDQVPLGDGLVVEEAVVPVILVPIRLVVLVAVDVVMMKTLHLTKQKSTVWEEPVVEAVVETAIT
jgi:hypothetical protein